MLTKEYMFVLSVVQGVLATPLPVYRGAKGYHHQLRDDPRGSWKFRLESEGRIRAISRLSAHASCAHQHAEKAAVAQKHWAVTLQASFPLLSDEEVITAVLNCPHASPQAITSCMGRETNEMEHSEQGSITEGGFTTGTVSWSNSP